MADSLFTKIINRQIPAEIVYEDDLCVAIKDINPQAPVHLLVLPEHHVDTFREIHAFSAHETKEMLEFVAEMAKQAGLTDYRVQVNVGPTAGQTVFHLHWHILGNVADRADVPAALQERAG
jgi:histidine triad (HIT) family protein